MTGHHIYTRAWYEYSKLSKNAGTFTVELTDGLFSPGANDVIYNKLNPVFGGTQPSIAGYTMEQSLLRMFHPTADSTVISRSYFVNDEITGRGIVQYSFGLVFTKNTSEAFLKHPGRAFELSAFETYDGFVNRIADDGTLKYSNSYDPKASDYNTPLSFPRDRWTSFGFNEDIFTKFFVSLGKAITSKKRDQKIAVILPADSNSESLILTVLSVLPPWLRRKFGAISRWTGAMSGNSAAAIDGIQLICYVGEKPPHDVAAPVIDLTGTGEHKNIEPITAEGQQFTKWYWDNIDRPEILEKLSDYMIKRYNQLMDKMPFDVFAHCFWLWLTFHENAASEKTGNLTFPIASCAINSLVSAFGRNLSEYFTDQDALVNIFMTYSRNLESADISEVTAGTVNAVCLLANNDIALGNIQARDLVNPLFNKLFNAGEWSKLEPVLQYYAKVTKEDKPAKAVIEALCSFARVLECNNKKLVDEAAAVCSRYAKAVSSDALAGNGRNRSDVYINIAALIKSKASLAGLASGPADESIPAEVYNTEIYKLIALLLKNAGRSVNIDIISLEAVPKSERSSRAFYQLEKFNRENIANIKPPDSGQLKSVLGAVSWLSEDEQKNALWDLLEIYWHSDEIKDQIQKQEYVQHLHENKMLPLFVKSKIGIDDIREIYRSKLNSAFDGNKFGSTDEQIYELVKWWNLLRDDCGFPESDPIFDDFDAKFMTLKNLCGTMSPKAAAQLATIFSGKQYSNEQKFITLIGRIDYIARVDGKFSELYSEWDDALETFKARMEYWCNQAAPPPPEWALSLAVIGAKIDNSLAANYQKIAETYLSFSKDEGDHKKDLLYLYEALRLIESEDLYGPEVTRTVFESVKSMILRIIKKLYSNDSLEVLFGTANKFETLYQGRMKNNYVPKMGSVICDLIKANYENKRSVPIEKVLIKFNPHEVRAAKAEAASSPVEDALLGSSYVALLIGTVSCVFLLLILGVSGLTRTLLLLIPEWLMIAMAISALAAFVCTLTGALRQFRTRGRR